MIEVIIDVIPHGQEITRKTIGKLIIGNSLLISGENKANYSYELRRGRRMRSLGKFPIIIAQGEIKDFSRDRGAFSLVCEVMKNIEENKKP